VIPALVTFALVALSSETMRGPLAVACGATFAVALVGWIDDVRDLRAITRFAVQLAAAVAIVVALGDSLQLSIGSTVIAIGPARYVLAVGLAVWLANLYNFMDGTNGIAGVEALSVGVVGGSILWAYGLTGLAAVAWSLAGAAAGFLLWNWHPAKIFMGDVGSCFVGLLFAALAFLSAAHEPHLLWPWMILLGVFVVDATTTLAVRAYRRERLSQAHNQHAYQHAARRWGHAKVATVVLAINLLYLAPLAIACALQPRYSLLWWGVAYAPLVVLCACLRAGRPDAAADSTSGAADQVPTE
jgi:Fuc2NAc and GlcNAc transferase